MKTNAMMMRELTRDFEPETFGILSGAEVDKVRNTLELKSRDIRSLRDLRDMVVLYFKAYGESIDQNEFTRMDKLSGITAVIDSEIWNKGGEV